VQDRGSQADAGELGNAKVSDNRSIREQKQRFRDQRTKRWNRESQDLLSAACAGRVRCGFRAGGGHGSTLAALATSHGYALVDISIETREDIT
jgi:hypothetical protein